MGLAAEDLTSPCHGGQVAFARSVATHVARQLGRIPISQMARRFHLDDSSLARPLSALEARLKEDLGLRSQIDQIVSEVRKLFPKTLDEGRSEGKSENQG
jgi:chromosomal replication initiation ATPase DnaA